MYQKIRKIFSSLNRIEILQLISLFVTILGSIVTTFHILGRSFAVITFVAALMCLVLSFWDFFYSYNKHQSLVELASKGRVQTIRLLLAYESLLNSGMIKKSKLEVDEAEFTFTLSPRIENGIINEERGRLFCSHHFRISNPNECKNLVFGLLITQPRGSLPCNAHYICNNDSALELCFHTFNCSRKAKDFDGYLTSEIILPAESVYDLTIEYELPTSYLIKDNGVFIVWPFMYAKRINRATFKVNYCGLENNRPEAISLNRLPYDGVNYKEESIARLHPSQDKSQWTVNLDKLDSQIAVYFINIRHKTITSGLPTD